MEPFVQAAAPAPAVQNLLQAQMTRHQFLLLPQRVNSAIGMALSTHSAPVHKVVGAGKTTPAVLLLPPAAANQIPMALWAAAIQFLRLPAPAASNHHPARCHGAPVTHPVLYRHRHLQA